MLSWQRDIEANAHSSDVADSARRDSADALWMTMASGRTGAAAPPMVFLTFYAPNPFVGAAAPDLRAFTFQIGLAFESLVTFNDTNGNGVYDPGTDALLRSDDLSTLPWGDVAVRRVDHDGVATYFLRANSTDQRFSIKAIMTQRAIVNRMIDTVVEPGDVQVEFRLPGLPDSGGGSNGTVGGLGEFSKYMELRVSVFSRETRKRTSTVSHKGLLTDLQLLKFGAEDAEMKNGYFAWIDAVLPDVLARHRLELFSDRPPGLRPPDVLGYGKSDWNVSVATVRVSFPLTPDRSPMWASWIGFGLPASDYRNLPAWAWSLALGTCAALAGSLVAAALWSERRVRRFEEASSNQPLNASLLASR